MEESNLVELRARASALGSRGIPKDGHPRLSSPRRAVDWLRRSDGMQGVELSGPRSGPRGNTMKFENMSVAELDARLKALLQKNEQEKKT
jgi:hypothetical protein